MTIIDDAIEMEERARSYYAESREKVSDPSGKKILELLATEEERHAQILAGMRTGDYGKLGSSSLVSEVKGLVEGAVNQGNNAISSDASLRGILQQAMEIEQATKKFYEEKGKTAADPEEVELFFHLATQELEHYLLVSSLAEYFDQPREWVESAEFGLRPEY